MHTKYYVTTQGIVEANSTSLGKSATAPIDPAAEVSPATPIVLALFSTYQTFWDTLDGVEPLPDPLRNQTLSPSLVTALAPLGVTATHTTFDVIDILTTRSKDFAFAIK